VAREVLSTRRKDGSSSTTSALSRSVVIVAVAL
jgi:hypothetical protein